MSHQLTLAPKTAPSCPSAKAPVVFQYDVTHTEGEGVAPVVAADIAPGGLAYYGGKIANNGCVPVDVVISYIDGADCDPCTDDTLSLVSIPLTIPSGASYTIPEGYWQDLVYTIDGGSGVPTGALHNIHIFSASAADPCCPIVAV